MDERTKTPKRFYFFSGKGGVGKTTLAAATAVHAARQGQRVLITSTDPAHSLSDVFDVSIGDEGKQIEPNLVALEIDPGTRWRAALSDEEEGLNGGVGWLQKTLLEATRLLGEAPGVDEFMCLELLLETITASDFDQVVFDTAPTGHTLRLLSLPEMLDGWLGHMLSLQTAFSHIGRLVRRFLVGQSDGDEPDLGGEMGRARDRVALARQLIMSPERTVFALVTIPEAMSVLETARTAATLSSHGIAITTIVANQIQPPSDDCQYCRQRHAIHQRELARLPAELKGIPITQVYSKPTVIRGVAALAELGVELAQAVQNPTASS